MNDVFDSQLRRHLMETADLRPADGQLMSVIDAVAAAPQRNSLTARLTWDSGRIGPVLTATIRYALIVVAIALALVAGASLGGGARQPSSVFEGTWITIDPADGSGMTLVVGPGDTPDVYYEDGYATGLACVNDVVKRFKARGTGEISGNNLLATFPDGGGCGLMTVEMRGVYDYDPTGGTLSDLDGVVWSRALGEVPEGQAPKPVAPATEPPATEPPPSKAPATEPPATAAPEAAGEEPSLAVATTNPDPDCIQFDAPGPYTAPAGSLSLTVAMPGTGSEPWSGDRDGFSVMQAACTDWSGTGWIDAGEVTLVDTSACTGARVRVETMAEAIEAVTVAEGIDVVEQTNVTIDGYAGTLLVIDVHDVPNGCPDQQIPLLDGVNPVDRGVGLEVYLVDVDGTTLALGLFGYPDWTSNVRTDVAGIIASLQIDP